MGRLAISLGFNPSGVDHYSDPSLSQAKGRTAGWVALYLDGCSGPAGMAHDWGHHRTLLHYWGEGYSDFSWWVRDFRGTDPAVDPTPPPSRNGCPAQAFFLIGRPKRAHGPATSIAEPWPKKLGGGGG